MDMVGLAVTHVLCMLVTGNEACEEICSQGHPVLLTKALSRYVCQETVHYNSL